MTGVVSGLRRLPSVLRAGVAVATLAGLLAMHGLSSGHDLAMSAMTGQMPAVESAPLMPILAVDETAAIWPADWPMHHSECVGTLRDAAHLKSPTVAGPGLITDPTAETDSDASTARTAAVRAPPDVSLTRLCISRT